MSMSDIRAVEPARGISARPGGKGGGKGECFNLLPNPLSPFQGARGLNQRFPSLEICAFESHAGGVSKNIIHV